MCDWVPLLNARSDFDRQRYLPKHLRHACECFSKLARMLHQSRSRAFVEDEVNWATTVDICETR